MVRVVGHHHHHHLRSSSAKAYCSARQRSGFDNSRDERRFFTTARRLGRLRCDGQKNHDDFETTTPFDDDEEMLENFLEPPRRDTGIPSEWDINIDIDEGTRRSNRRRKSHIFFDATRRRSFFSVMPRVFRIYARPTYK